MSKYFRCPISVFLLWSMAAIPSIANATVITSVDRATFQAAVAGGTVNNEDFDGLAVGTILGATADLTYAASEGNPIVTDSFLTSTAPNGLGSTSVGFFTATETAIFTFHLPISAFAIDINTFATTDGAYTASLDTGDVVTSLFEVFPSQLTGQFIGFVSDTPFTSVTIDATTDDFSYTLDTLTYGDAEEVIGNVPIPTAAWLFGSALLGLIGVKRKKA